MTHQPTDRAAAHASQQGETTPSELDLLRAENEALARQNHVLRETLDTIEGAVVVYDSERRFVFSNNAYHAIYPHLPPEEELVGRKYEELLAMSIAAGLMEDQGVSTDTAAFIQRRIADMERRRHVPPQEFATRPGRQTRQTKTDRWYLVRSRRTPGGNDVTLRVDITAQKRLEDEASSARAAAERANAMKSNFLASIGHELRTPLNAVINFARLIVEEIYGPLGSPQYRDFARDIAEAGGHLLTLIDELLDLAKAEAGHLTIGERVAEPGSLVAAACRIMQPVASAAGITLTSAIAPDLGRMRADPVRLRQVLLNLIANAVKFTRSGGAIRISAGRDAEGGLTVSVQDNGIGIREVDLVRVFEPFARVDDTRVNAQPGVGLGLPLARHLIELHGGTLTLQSEPGKGTTATMKLPADRMEVQ